MKKLMILFCFIFFIFGCSKNELDNNEFKRGKIKVYMDRIEKSQYTKIEFKNEKYNIDSVNNISIIDVQTTNAYFDVSAYMNDLFNSKNDNFNNDNIKEELYLNRSDFNLKNNKIYINNSISNKLYYITNAPINCTLTLKVVFTNENFETNEFIGDMNVILGKYSYPYTIGKILYPIATFFIIFLVFIIIIVSAP
uniref:hypothetical protein n=1 Tax=Brachyspira catarrhinii TaxID=2528966 RepID=UPI003F4C65E9